MLRGFGNWDSGVGTAQVEGQKLGLAATVRTEAVEMHQYASHANSSHMAMMAFPPPSTRDQAMVYSKCDGTISGLFCSRIIHSGPIESMRLITMSCSVVQAWHDVLRAGERLKLVETVKTMSNRCKCMVER